MAKEKTTITVAGREYTILSEEGGEYVNRVAYDLNQKIAALNAENVGLSTVTLLALTALNLTDELFKAREALEASRQELEEIREALHKAEIQNRLPPKNRRAARLSETSSSGCGSRCGGWKPRIRSSSGARSPAFIRMRTPGNRNVERTHYAAV